MDVISPRPNGNCVAGGGRSETLSFAQEAFARRRSCGALGEREGSLGGGGQFGEGGPLVKIRGATTKLALVLAYNFTGDRSTNERRMRW